MKKTIRFKLLFNGSCLEDRNIPLQKNKNYSLSKLISRECEKIIDPTVLKLNVLSIKKNKAYITPFKQSLCIINNNLEPSFKLRLQEDSPSPILLQQYDSISVEYNSITILVKEERVKSPPTSSQREGLLDLICPDQYIFQSLVLGILICFSLHVLGFLYVKKFARR